MIQDGTLRRRHLPHWDVEARPYYITACLEGSLPPNTLHELRDYRQLLDAQPQPKSTSYELWQWYKQKRLFARFDDALDYRSPVRHLADPRQAEVVQNALLCFAGLRYELFSFVIMPSHYHWLFLPDEQWSVDVVQTARNSGRPLATPREIIMHSIQSYTANMCNRIRGSKGRYWHNETFDHWVRDEAELHAIIEYIENNPVKAGLASSAAEWQWSSARLRAELGIEPGQGIVVPGVR